jgi:hypothetical protein
MMATFSEWSPYEKFVQAGMVDGEFLNAGFTVLAAGPPRLANIGGSTAVGGALDQGVGADQMVMPIGVIQNVNLSHNRTFNRIFEVGSERSYFISGRTIGQLSIARILYHGPSLLRMLYAYYEDAIPPTIVDAVFPNAGVISVANPHDVIIPPGFENLFMNLASDLFNQPVGILMYVRDSNMKTYGAVYMESCYVPNHTWATDAQGVIIQESAAIQFERAVPVAVSAISLIAGAAGSALGIGS